MSDHDHIQEAFDTLEDAMRAGNCGRSGLNWLEVIQDHVRDLERDHRWLPDAGGSYYAKRDGVWFCCTPVREGIPDEYLLALLVEEDADEQDDD